MQLGLNIQSTNTHMHAHKHTHTYVHADYLVSEWWLSAGATDYITSRPEVQQATLYLLKVDWVVFDGPPTPTELTLTTTTPPKKALIRSEPVKAVDPPGHNNTVKWPAAERGVKGGLDFVRNYIREHDLAICGEITISQENRRVISMWRVFICWYGLTLAHSMTRRPSQMLTMMIVLSVSKVQQHPLFIFDKTHHIPNLDQNSPQLWSQSWICPNTSFASFLFPPISCPRLKLSFTHLSHSPALIIKYLLAKDQ